jgi:hypothetical protein
MFQWETQTLCGESTQVMEFSALPVVLGRTLFGENSNRYPLLAGTIWGINGNDMVFCQNLVTDSWEYVAGLKLETQTCFSGQ